MPPRRRSAARGSAREAGATADAPFVLAVGVTWGDLVQTAADLHVVGQYRGVPPAQASLALDKAISRSGCGVIADHTRRRLLTGDLGTVTYFPGCDEAEASVHRAAVVGMGRAGTFTPDRASRLWESLLTELATVASIDSVATVAIGSSLDNLRLHQVARALGRACETLDRRGVHGVPHVNLVERDVLRARRLHDALVAEAARLAGVDADGAQFNVTPMGASPGGAVSPTSAAVYVLRSAMRELSADADRLTSVVRGLHTGVDLPEDAGTALSQALTKAVKSLVSDGGEVADVRIETRETAETLARGSLPTRVTVLGRAGLLTWSALSARSAVPERVVPVDSGIVADLVRRLTPPVGSDAALLPQFLSRFMVPRDLRGVLLGDTPLILEVDASTAAVPWELLVCDPESTNSAASPGVPLCLLQPLTRQMRTSYARTDVDDDGMAGLNALVVGDPSSKLLPLPGARAEAKAVAALMRKRGLQVELMLGEPDDPADGVPPATRLDVLARLMTGNYDIVHVAGHGVHEPGRPEVAGWLFGDGILTARELANLSVAPRMVVANACWTAPRPGGPQPSEVNSAELAPVLADELLRVGTGHVIVTGWPVPDGEAKQFAEALYSAALPGPGEQEAVPIGEAMLGARQSIYGTTRTTSDARRSFAWACYQHYGDPSDVLVRE